MEQFMQRYVTGQKEQKRVPLRVQFSVCACAQTVSVCVCVCLCVRSQKVILKHKQHKDQHKKNIYIRYSRYFQILHRRPNYCDIIANIRYIAQP